MPEIMESPVELIEIKNIHLDYLTDDDTQQVTGGWIILQGKLQPMTFTEIEQRRDSDSISWEVIVDERASASTHGHLDSIYDNLDQESTEGNFYYMPCIASRYENKEGNVFILSLMLQVVDKEKGIFSRLGLLTLWPNKSHQTNFYAIKKERRTSPARVIKMVTTPFV